MNLISTKIKTFCDINSTFTSNRFLSQQSDNTHHIPVNLSINPKLHSLHNIEFKQKNVLFYENMSKIPKIFSFESVFNFSEEDMNDIYKGLIHDSLSKTLEGIDSSLLIIEHEGEEMKMRHSQFWEIIFWFLNYLKQLADFLQNDNINMFYRISLFKNKDDILMDYMEEENELMANKIEEDKGHPFLDLQEFIDYFNNLFENQGKVDETHIWEYLTFRININLTDIQSKTSWRGEYLISSLKTKDLEEISSFLKKLIEIQLDEELMNNSSEMNSFSTNLARMATEKKFLTVFYHLEEIKNISKNEYKKIFESLDKLNQSNQNLTKNPQNDLAEFFNLFSDYQKMLYAKNEEISALKLSNYYKDKENDELKLKISELESELQVKNTPIQNELGEINTSLSEQKQEKEIYSLKDVTMNYSISVVNSSRQNEYYEKPKSSSLIPMSGPTFITTQMQDTILQDENEAIEVSYSEELDLLRTKYQITNKMYLQCKQSNEKLLKNLDQEKFDKNEFLIQLKEAEQTVVKLKDEIEKKNLEEKLLGFKLETQESALKLKYNVLDEEILNLQKIIEKELEILIQIHEIERQERKKKDIMNIFSFVLDQLNTKYIKNKEIQNELNDLYEAYSRLSFQHRRTTNKV